MEESPIMKKSEFNIELEIDIEGSAVKLAKKLTPLFPKKSERTVRRYISDWKKGVKEVPAEVISFLYPVKEAEAVVEVAPVAEAVVEEMDGIDLIIDTTTVSIKRRDDGKFRADFTEYDFDKDEHVHLFFYHVGWDSLEVAEAEGEKLGELFFKNYYNPTGKLSEEQCERVLEAAKDNNNYTISFYQESSMRDWSETIRYKLEEIDESFEISEIKHEENLLSEYARMLGLIKQSFDILTGVRAPIKKAKKKKKAVAVAEEIPAPVAEAVAEEKPEIRRELRDGFWFRETSPGSGRFFVEEIHSSGNPANYSQRLRAGGKYDDSCIEFLKRMNSCIEEAKRKIVDLLTWKKKNQDLIKDHRKGVISSARSHAAQKLSDKLAWYSNAISNNYSRIEEFEFDISEILKIAGNIREESQRLFEKESKKISDKRERPDSEEVSRRSDIIQEIKDVTLVRSDRGICEEMANHFGSINGEYYHFNQYSIDTPEIPERIKKTTLVGQVQRWRKGSGWSSPKWGHLIEEFHSLLKKQPGFQNKLTFSN